jgi:hypothetical protein
MDDEKTIARIASLEEEIATLRRNPDSINERDAAAAEEGRSEAEMLGLFEPGFKTGLENVTERDMAEGRKALAEDIIDRLEIERKGVPPKVQEIILVLILELEERKARGNLDDSVLLLDRLSETFATSRQAKKDQQGHRMQAVRKLLTDANTKIIETAIRQARNKKQGKSRSTSNSIEGAVLAKLKAPAWIASPAVAAIFNQLEADLKAAGVDDKKTMAHVQKLKDNLAEGKGAREDKLYKTLPKKGT